MNKRIIVFGLKLRKYKGFFYLSMFSAYNKETKRINLVSSICRYGVMVSQRIANPSSGLNRYLGSSPSVGVNPLLVGWG